MSNETKRRLLQDCARKFEERKIDVQTYTTMVKSIVEESAA